MKTSENFLAPLRRKVALDITDNENKQAEQNRNFNHVVREELQATDPAVRRVEAEEKTAGGIIIPDNAKEKPAEGEIIAVGEGAYNEDGDRIKPDVKEGDRILFGKWSGTEIKVDGEDLLIMKESDILGILG